MKLEYLEKYDKENLEDLIKRLKELGVEQKYIDDIVSIIDYRLSDMFDYFSRDNHEYDLRDEYDNVDPFDVDYLIDDIVTDEGDELPDDILEDITEDSKIQEILDNMIINLEFNIDEVKHPYE